jgi:hypothetical protein
MKHKVTRYRPISDTMENLLPFILLLFLFIPSHLSAANYYLRAGATGSRTGADWANAYTNPPIDGNNYSTLSRGDTLYVAAGTYSGNNYFEQTDNGRWIYVKKATIADHGTSTGWNNSYATGQANFTARWIIDKGHIDINGVTGGGPGSWDSGHGFRFTQSACSIANNQGIWISTGNSNYVNIQHVHFKSGCTPPAWLDATGNGYGPSILSVLGSSNLLVQYCWFDGIYGASVQFSAVANATFKYNYTSNMTFTNAYHASVYNSNSSNTNTVIAYNWSINSLGSFYGEVAAVGGQDVTTNGVDIYGNIIDNSSDTVHSLYDRTNNAIANNYRVYNNTFVNGAAANTPYYAVALECTTSPGNNKAYNNLFYNWHMASNYPGWAALAYNGRTCPGSYSSVTVHDYNYHSLSDNWVTETHDLSGGTTNPFVNLAGFNYQLASPITGRTDLGAPYNTDMYGNVGTNVGAIQSTVGTGAGGLMVH